jgi:hypothetical protein
MEPAVRDGLPLIGSRNQFVEHKPARSHLCRGRPKEYTALAVRRGVSHPVGMKLHPDLVAGVEYLAQGPLLILRQ